MARLTFESLNPLSLEQLSRISEDEARAALERIRWPNGTVCPHCGVIGNSVRIGGKAARPGLWRCKDCRKQFTVTVKSIFEDSRIPIRKWLLAFHLICSSKKGISALQLQRNLGLGSYQTAWFMAHRIRHAMLQEPLASLLTGTVEVDETYVGGKPRKGTGPHKRGRGTRKTPVVALVERGGRVRSKKMERLSGENLKAAVRENVHPLARIMSDELAAYKGIGKHFEGGHALVNHSRGEYARGDVHVNNAESYFALLKRGVMGAFHHVSARHLGRYCDEFSFRWDHRGTSDGERMVTALQKAEGKRLMYKQTRP